MANVIKHKRGSGSDPVASDLVVGELAIRTDTGKLFTKMDSGALAEIAGGGSDIAINTLSSSSGTGGGSATFNGSAYRFTLSSPPSVSAAQLLVSINGVIQKPVAGTGQPSEGFSVDGNDIILGDAPATGSDFFILTFRSLGVSVPADNSVTSAKIADGAIVNADINASAAIAGTKIDPSFTSDITISNSAPSIALIDTDSNSDFSIFGSQGEFRIRDQSNTTNRLTINSSGGVGIGTSGIDRRFHVEGTDNVLGKFQNDQSICLIEFEDTDTTAGNRPSIGSDGNNAIVFAGGSQRLVIDSTGRVGINQTSFATSDTMLSISETSGHCEIGIISKNDSGAVINLGDPDSYNRGRIKYDNSDNSLTFRTNGTDALSIDSSQNVGIGTTSPDRTIHCHNSSNTTNVRAKFSNGTTGEGASDGFEIGINGSDPAQAVLVNNENSPMAFFTNASERMRIDSSGSVLVGTTTLGEGSADNLTVADSGHCGITIRSGSSSGGNLFFTDATSDQFQGFVQYNHSSNHLGLGTNKIERMRITSDGTIQLRNSSGIDFSQIQTNSSGMSSETLDSYEEGTFTPVLSDAFTGGNSASSGVQIGWYTKIGNLVNVQGRIGNSNTSGMTSSNAAYVQGLPFVIKQGTSRLSIGSAHLSNVNASSNTVNLTVLSNTSSANGSSFRFFEMIDNAAHQSVKVSQISSGTNELIFNFTYRTT